MKYPLILILASLLFTLSSYAQSNDNTNYSLAVEKATNGSPRNLVFKPHSRLKLKTTAGDRYTAEHYSISEDYIFIQTKKDHNTTNTYGYTSFSAAHVSDSIALSNIEWIKGKVFKDGGRKAMGGLVVLGGTAMLFIPFAAVVLGAVGIGIALTFPVVMLIIEGGNIMGARKFKTVLGWQVKTLQ